EEMAFAYGNYLASDPVARMAWRQRQIRIARAVLEGASLAAVGEQELVTRSRVRQILQMACSASIKVPGRKVKVPIRDPWRMASFREHKGFWLARIATLERVWKLPKENRRIATLS